MYMYILCISNYMYLSTYKKAACSRGAAIGQHTEHTPHARVVCRPKVMRMNAEPASYSMHDLSGLVVALHICLALALPHRHTNFCMCIPRRSKLPSEN